MGKQTNSTSLLLALGATLVALALVLLPPTKRADPAVAVPVPPRPAVAAQAVPPAPQSPASTTIALPSGCVECHSSSANVKSAAAPPAPVAPSAERSGVGWSGETPSLAVEDRFTVQPEFLSSTHGRQRCSSCHGGVEAAADKATAHQGLEKDPSEDADKACGTCHGATVASAQQSLHATLGGIKAALAGRGGSLTDGPLRQAYNTHCTGCHASCGQCHVSRPTAAGGGLLAGHQFKRMASVPESCTWCHASHVGSEYFGSKQSLAGDVHWTKAAMHCAECHGGTLHAASPAGEHRYGKDEGPRCGDCHKTLSAGTPQHDIHGDRVSCQVCHSLPYQNCTACHVGKDTDGMPYFKAEGAQLAFKIGLNPIQSRERPYKYVPIRHVPALPQTFAYYGDNLQPSFDAVPTWKYATPHNIQRKTPQNSSCNACHGNDALYLTAADVEPAELEANRKVIVPSVPAAR